MALRPSLITRGLSGANESSDTGSPAEQRDDAKKNMLKKMRPLPTQHYWNIYFDRYDIVREEVRRLAHMTKTITGENDLGYNVSIQSRTDWWSD